MAKKSYRHYKEEFINLYKEGMSIRAIADKYDIHKSSVARLIREDIPIRDKSTAYQFKDKIYDLYKKGYGIYQIASLISTDELRIRGDAVKRILFKEFDIVIPSNPKNGELIPIFIKLYQEGKTLNDIANEYNVSKQTVLNYINLGGLKARDYHESSLKTYLNEEYFDILDNKKAYQLGLIFAMGCVHKENVCVFLDLSITSNKKEFIFKAIEGISDKGYENLEWNHDDSISSIRISSKHMCSKLLEYGLSKKIDIPKEHRTAFFKGFFETNLNITNRNIAFPTKNRYNEDVKFYLLNDIGIDEEYYKSHKGTTPYITNINAIKKLLEVHPEILEKFSKKANIVKWNKLLLNYK